MEDNGKCILVKRKELQELRAKANDNKPDHIDIVLYASRYVEQIRTNLEFSERLDRQLRRLIKLALNKIALAEGEIIKDTREDCYRTLAQMPWYKRRKFLKQYE